ncbi:MAG: spore coat protein CotH [Oscillibacter sp.]|nr:spore coat protein CotH [Oscillibacter sp.]
MATHKYIDRICAAVLALTLVLALLFVNGEALGLQAAERTMGYENRLFDSSRVHTIDIVMDDWDSFIETCENEEYQLCALVIDGEAERKAAIRAKGNTSLTSVASYGNDRYSFKVEFDHYDSGNTYYGLDKLSLNNLIQDNTYMKDFLVYQLMRRFGAAAPLCSYVSISVNGEPWGLYLAVEGVEDAFLQRNYGGNHGNLYKPDSMSFGGGRGNGGDFHMDDLMEKFGEQLEDLDLTSIKDAWEEGQFRGGRQSQEDRQQGRGGGDFGGMGGGMGSSDVKLQYIDDDPDSYANIFDNAKTDITEADKARLINSLQILSSGENVESVVDVEQVIRYFVVHGFVCNGDSYTGSMIHNYYLYEDGGVMSMIPWDYNLAFGGFQSNNASSAVNEPIDTPVSGGSLEDRPMLAWIFADEEYTALYHQYYDEFLSAYLENGACQQLIEDTAAIIAPYVEQDPTKFCTYEEFEAGIEALKTFCELRTQSVRGQLDGTIPSTTQDQRTASATLVSTSGLNLSDMGSMNAGGKGGGPGGGDFGGGMPQMQDGEMPEMPGGGMSQALDGEVPDMPDGEMPQMPGGDISEMPGGELSEMPDGETPEMPDGASTPAFAPDHGDFTPSEDNQPSQPGGQRENGFQDMGGPSPVGNAGSSVILLAVSVVVLAAGLVFAALFRRRR